MRVRLQVVLRQQKFLRARVRAAITGGKEEGQLCSLVCVDGKLEVGNAAKAALAVVLGGGGALDEMVAVDGGGDGGLGEAGGDELEHCHLRGGVLHGHAVCSTTSSVSVPSGRGGGAGQGGLEEATHLGGA